MSPCDVDVIGEDGDGRDDVRHEPLPVSSGAARRHLHTDFQLGDRDGGDRHVIVVSDQFVELGAGSLGVDEECGVEEKPSQLRSSTSSRPRTEASSLLHFASGRCRRSIAFTSAPRPALSGWISATARPRLTTTYRSPSCSTASRRSAKFLAASVAVISGTGSDYQIPRVGSYHGTP